MATLMDEQQRRAVPIVLVGVLATAAFAVVGALQILVWNPMAAVPDMSLPEIRAAMSAADEPLVPAPVYVWALAGPVLALIVGALSILRIPDLPWTIARLFLLIVLLGTPTYVFVSFGPGMSIADTFASSGGDHAPWSRILYGMSLIALIFLLMTFTKKDHPRRATI